MMMMMIVMMIVMMVGKTTAAHERGCQCNPKSKENEQERSYIENLRSALSFYLVLVDHRYVVAYIRN